MRKPTYPRVKIERGRDVMVESLLSGTEIVIRVRVGTYQEGRLVIKPKWQGEVDERVVKVVVERLEAQSRLKRTQVEELVRLRGVASERAKKDPEWWETAE